MGFPLDIISYHIISYYIIITESCVVKIFYCVKEINATNGEGEIRSEEPKFSPERQPPSVTRYERGLSQVYEQPSSDYLDLSLFKEEELVFNGEENYFPVVIVLSTGNAG